MPTYYMESVFVVEREVIIRTKSHGNITKCEQIPTHIHTHIRGYWMELPNAYYYLHHFDFHLARITFVRSQKSKKKFDMLIIFQARRLLLANFFDHRNGRTMYGEVK
jgi:hypothetical protein